MPDDLSSPTLKADFLATLRNLCRAWKKETAHGSICISTCTCLKKANTCVRILVVWPLPVFQLTQLPERYCCWQCHLPQPDGSHMKSLWPRLTKFIWHWYESHSNEWTDPWDTIAIHLNVTCSDLAFALLGVDLQSCPLPFSDDARRAFFARIFAMA